MKTARVAARLSSLALLLHGCAASAIVEGDGGSPYESENNEAPLDAGDDRDEDDEDDAPSAARPDASRPGTPRPDAAVDAGPARDASTVDAATPRDASAPVDASRPQPVDASRPPIPPDAATPTNPNVGLSCKVAATDCTNACVPLGVFTCCTADNKCGCTWAPGAYCF